MIKIEVTKEMRKCINSNHKEYIEKTSLLNLESKINGSIIEDKRITLLKKLFGNTPQERQASIFKFCLSHNLEEQVEIFNSTFSEVYGFKFSDTSKEEYKKIISTIREDLDGILDYSRFNVGIKLKSDKKWNRHRLITSLGVKVCPYCNRQYITSYKDEGDDSKTTADADHYYPRAEYPILQMNIFNLVPSCSVCNSRTKGKKNMRHLYPYVDSSNSLEFGIPLEIGGQVSEVLIDTKGNIKAENSKEVFKLNKIYQAHLDEAAEVKRNAANYFKYRDKTYEVLQGLEVPFDIFSTWFSFMGKDPLKEPLTKLKQDIFKQMKDELEK